MRRANLLISALATAAVIGIAMIAVNLSDSINDQVEREFAIYQSALAESSAKTLSLFFGELENELLLLSSVPSVQNLDIGQAHREFRAVVEKHQNQLFTILLVDYRGEIIADPLYGDHVEELKQQIRALFKKMLKNRGPTMSNKIVYRGRFQGFALGVPLIKNVGDDKRMVTGMIVAYISQANLVANLLDPIDIKEGATAFIMTHNGLWSRPEDNQIVREIIHNRWQTDKGGELVTKMVSGKRDTVWFDENVPGKKPEPTLLSYSPSRFADVTWAVVLRTPKAEITKLVRKSQMQSLVMALFAVLVVMVGGMSLMRINRVRAVAEEKARYSAELADKNRELEKLSRIKDEFVSIVSHDLRSPIGVIQGFAKVMLPEAEETGQNLKPVEAIIRSADRLLGMINDILDLARVEAGELKLSFSDVEVSGLIKETFKAAEFNAEQKRIRLVYEAGDAPKAIRADNNKLYQVMNNLIGNAIKFSPENETITVRSSSVNGTLKISVSDNGPGLSEEEQEAVFDRFKQVGRKHAGSGLGLAICKQLIELHSGRIWVESKQGEGADFLFSVPVNGSERETEN
ncbi:MAG: ATP-binding protein [Nitrospinota bacterium]